jgi:hypothetical protein
VATGAGANSALILPDGWYLHAGALNPDLFQEGAAHYGAITEDHVKEKIQHLGGVPAAAQTKQQLITHLIQLLRALPAAGSGAPSNNATPVDLTLASTASTASTGELDSSAGGLDLRSLRARSDLRERVTGLATDAANFYEDIRVPSNEDGDFLHKNITVQLGVPRVGSIIIALPERVVATFGASELAAWRFSYYRVTDTQSHNKVICCLLTSNVVGGSNKRPADWDPAADAVLTITPGGLLCVKASGSLYSELTRQYIGKTSAGQATTSSERPGMRTYLETMNDRVVHYLERGKLEERLTNSLMARRLMQDEIFKNYSPSEVDFDPSTVWKHLVLSGEEWLQSTQQFSGERQRDHSRHYVTLQQLPCVANNDVFTQLFTEGMLNIARDKCVFIPSLQSFSPWVLDDPDLSATSAKTALSQALLHFEEFLRFTCGDIYKDVTCDLRSSIVYGALSQPTWEPSYCRFLAESTLSAFFKDIKTTSTSTFRQRLGKNVEDIGVPAGARALLCRKLGSISPNGDGQNLLLRRVSAATARAPTGGNKKAGAAAPKVPPPPVSPDAICKIQFLHDLGVTGLAGTVYPPCARTGCKFKHGQVGTAKRAVLLARVKQLTDHKPVPLLAGAVLERTRAAIAARP